MEQKSDLDKTVSIEGTLLMLDDATPHVAVPVQVIRDGEVIATALSGERGRYQFINLKPGEYQLLCQVLGGYVYYGEEKTREPENAATPDKPIGLRVEQGGTLTDIDFRFAPFKKGTWRTYAYLEGLTHDWVEDIYRDPDGIMWFATNGGGISRYDGRTFTNLTARDGLASTSVYAIHRDSDGIMWFGTSGGVSRYNGETFVNLTTEDGLPHNLINAIYEDPDGVMWFGTESGVSRYDGREFANFATEDGLAHSQVNAIHRSQDGVMWFGTSNDGVFRYDARGMGDFPHFVNFTTEDGLPHNHVRAIHEDPDGVMWFGTADGVSRYDSETFVCFTTGDGLAHNNVYAIHEDQNGVMWFATHHSGISRYDGATFVNFTTRDGLAHNMVRAIHEDPDGVIWFGTSGGGVSRYDERTLIKLTTEDGLVYNDIVSSHIDTDGVMWFGTTGGGVSRYDGDTFVNFTAEDGLAHNSVWAIYQNPDGVMWFGTAGGGVSRYDGKTFVNLTTEDGLPHNNVWAIYQDPDGVMWFGTLGGGVSRYDGKEFVNLTTEDGLASNHVISIHRDSHGTMWFGMWHGGVCRYDGSEFVNLSIEDGFVYGHVWTIYADSDDVMWFGTYGGGVSRYDGQTSVHFTREDGLAHNTVVSIYQDTDGVMWFGTAGGGVTGYDGFAWTLLDTRDGLPDNVVNGIFQDADGFLWFGTRSGISRYRPSKTSPSTHIASVTTDRTYSDLSALPSFTAGTRITIQYGALDFKTIPDKQQYRCRIQASGKSLSKKEVDSDWRKPTKSDIFDFIFDEPGTYTFEVQAIDRDLNYSEPASVELEVIPDPRDLRVSQLESDLMARDQQLAILQSEMGEKYHFQDIIGDSGAMRWVRGCMEHVIDSDVNVLITGETGTGKELVAKGIHYNSSRKDKPPIPYDCGAISRELVASELFGHKKGAFTGAVADRIGLFETAEGSTVILDEIGNMPLDIQATLLRVLEERKVQRVGENISRDIDVRVIAMTDRDLSKEIADGRFREALFYRINGFHIHILPLRDEARVDDIPLLAEHFYQEACHEQKKELNGFAPGVLDMLASYPWPGNVRELRNEIHRACLLAKEGTRIQTYHFSPDITQGESLMQEIMSEHLDYNESVKRFRRRLIEDALRECGGNRTQAARSLGMDRTTLVHAIKNLGIDA